MGILTGPYKTILGALNLVKHELQGDPTHGNLMSYNQGTGQLEPFKPVMVVKGDTPIGLGVTVEEFRVAEEDMTGEDAKKLAAIQYGDRIYSIGKRVSPNGLQRFWSLQVKPAESA
jgi:hypothetical protein